ncbi:MAG: response regulator, partial [Candidatus Zixiibacteriota bacterium]
NGIEVLRRVKKEYPNVEVIILTGHGSDKEKAISEELGAFAYLQKPVDIDVLAKVMRDAYQKISRLKADSSDSQMD